MCVTFLSLSLARSLPPSLLLSLALSRSLPLSLCFGVSRRESKSPVQIFQIDPENDGIESQRKELEAVFDEVASEVGPDVHPDRANSLGHVQQGNPNCSGLAHGARHDVRADSRVSGRSAVRYIMHACVHLCMHACVCMYVCICMCVFVCVCVRRGGYVCVHKFLQMYTGTWPA